MRLGLFGGTFNPIHRCHLTIATETQAHLALDQILFIPSGDPPHKSSASLAPAADRYTMVQQAIESNPAFQITDIEMNRTSKSYTVETLQALSSQYPPSTEFFFIIGLDAFLDCPSWKDATRLFSLCHFVVVSRPMVSFVSLEGLSLLPPLNQETVQALHALDQGHLTQYDLPTDNKHFLRLLRLPPCLISASEIRNRVQQGGSLSSLLPESVESYIIGRGLYKEKSDLT